MSINGDALKYVAMGPGWSGDTDDISVAEAWLRTNNGNGAIYIRRDIAMLEPHDAARLRETIAEIIARKAFRWNESVVGIPYRSMSEEDRCKDIADAVIRAIGGAQ